MKTEQPDQFVIVGTEQVVSGERKWFYMRSGAISSLAVSTSIYVGVRGFKEAVKTCDKLRRFKFRDNDLNLTLDGYLGLNWQVRQL